MALETAIRAFITSNFYVANPSALDAEASLLDNGVIDSTGVLELITFVEAEFGVKVEDDEMLPENLD
jgi:acyl carrier protein